jgi:hypothetical protein
VIAVTDAAGRWTAVLDEFEATLDAYVALAVVVQGRGSDQITIPPFDPQDDLGPLPAKLTVRATELAARSALIETELVQARDDVATQLTALSRPAHVYGSVDTGSRLDQIS